jgi:ABC-type multidrug transport system ATPase subunit
VSFLVLEGVGKSYRVGSRVTVALRDVSLSLSAGEVVTIYGRRRSGRSTLLRVAAGLERPDTGFVRLDGDEVAGNIGVAIGYCQKSLGPPRGDTVLELVALSMLARGLARSAARSRARMALERVECASLLNARPSDLDATERIRVAIARALAGNPRLLVVDEPTLGIDLLDRDRILLLLSSLASEGTAVLTCTGDSPGFLGADRALSINDGRLHGQRQPQIAPVIPLRRSSAM